MLQKWVKCQHMKILGYFPDFATEGCKDVAKYVQDDNKPICELHADRFARLRYLEPADVEKWGQL